MNTKDGPKMLDVEVESFEIDNKDLIINLIITPTKVGEYLKHIINSQYDDVRATYKDFLSIRIYGRANDILDEPFYVSLMPSNSDTIINNYMYKLEEFGILNFLRENIKNAEEHL